MRMDVTLDNNDIERSSEKSLRLLCRIARMNGFGATELSENNFITRVSIQDSRAGDYAADYSKVVRLVKLFRAAGFGVQINPPPPWISQDYPDIPLAFLGFSKADEEEKRVKPEKSHLEKTLN